ncbi:hypothetical protein HW115_03630 [Verrucomicrobiaceae bacterium N1E253]|uniref:Uncharacterized protein n=1 Tax=Oceaniferula marina TaxID=2748318 RepID=A0A851GHT1_9BACT|nr:hypothetical protein [Oceaniferula marina]NWK54687.1 hypothetical protein [Oceaniferula marina]
MNESIASVVKQAYDAAIPALAPRFKELRVSRLFMEIPFRLMSFGCLLRTAYWETLLMPETRFGYALT